MEATTALRGRSSFVVRLMAVLVLTALAVGVAQYLLVGRALRSTALAELERSQRADASVIHDLSVAADPESAVREILGHIASRPGIDQAVLLDAEGEVDVIGMPAHASPSHADMSSSEGTAHTDEMAHADGEETQPPGEMEMSGEAVAAAIEDLDFQPDSRRAREVARLGRSATSIDSTGHLTVWAPVDIAGEVHVLEVVRDGEDLRKSVGALREVILWTIGIGLAVLVPLFYLAGGRHLASRHHEALESSATDALTKLGNHRAFHDDLRRSIDIAHRHRRSLTLVLIDLDGFKQVNDTEGHTVGDRVLAAVGIVLRSGRPGDLAYRIGGDEFAFLLPETQLRGATVAAERVRAAIDRGVPGVTASIGVAELSIASPDAPSLLELADRALYAAKERGRNRIVRADELDEPRTRMPRPE